MHSKFTYGHLLVSIFSEEITLNDHYELAREVSQLASEKGEIFVISFIQPGGKHLQNVPEIIKVFQLSNSYMKRIRRFYALRHHPVVSFISSVVSRVVDIHANYVEAKTLDELFERVERDAQRFPNLKASLKDWDAIKAQIKGTAAK